MFRFLERNQQSQPGKKPAVLLIHNALKYDFLAIFKERNSNYIEGKVKQAMTSLYHPAERLPKPIDPSSARLLTISNIERLTALIYTTQKLRGADIITVQIITVLRN